MRTAPRVRSAERGELPGFKLCLPVYKSFFFSFQRGFTELVMDSSPVSLSLLAGVTDPSHEH